MPQIFTASEIDILKTSLPSVFQSNATISPELTNQPVAAPYILGKQTANISPIFAGAGELCTGVTVWYLIGDDTAKPTVSATPIASTCDLTTGDTVSSASQDYDFNIFEKESILVNDKDCDNYAKFMDKSAFNLNHKMSLMVQSFNDTVINTLEANKTTASASLLPDDVTIGAGLDYTITGAAFWKGEGAADTLAILDQLARLNGLPNNYYIVSGKALRVPYDIARDHAVNDNERSYAVTFQRRDIVWDEDNLDALIGAEVIYLVDPNATIGYFYNEYPAEGVNTNDKNNTVNFSIPLSYYDMYQDGSGNMRSVMFANNGVMQEARIDVRYQKACNTSGRYGKVSHDHIWELDMIALFDVVPATGDFTGIVRVDKAL